MRSTYSLLSIALLSVAVLNSSRAAAQDYENSFPPPADPAQEQPEVLSRGPVHEAFAEPIPEQEEEGLIVPQQPPPVIDEIPPEERPEGSQYVWIPGYWAWDTDKNDYIWVSACWRAAPPNMDWVPGYWAEVPDGWEWISGYWTPVADQEPVYLPEPPPILSEEPASIQPSPDAIWVPPCMYWSCDRYVYRAGYWLTAQENWIWVPSHYITTPHGYVFVAGHWDYPLERRGVLFAPVYFPAGRTVSVTYCPTISINIDLVQVNLFTRPRYRHYYFGDYYDAAYLNIGIRPWFNRHRHHSRRDPIYEHCRWKHHRFNPTWDRHNRDRYQQRRENRALRPAHTFREQQSRHRSTDRLARPFNAAESRIRLKRISTNTRRDISKRAAEKRKKHTIQARTRRESPRIVRRKTTQPEGQPHDKRQLRTVQRKPRRTREPAPSGSRPETSKPRKTVRRHTVTPSPSSPRQPAEGQQKTIQTKPRRTREPTPAGSQPETSKPRKTGRRIVTPPTSGQRHPAPPAQVRPRTPNRTKHVQAPSSSGSRKPKKFESPRKRPTRNPASGSRKKTKKTSKRN